MELIVADSGGRTLFPLCDFELDMDEGWGDGVNNTFDLIVRDPSAPLPKAAWRFFVDGSEIGGRVEGFELKTGRNSTELHWKGSTWTGVLCKRLLWPDPGSDFLTLSGDANDVLRSVVRRLGLSALFTVPDGAAGTTLRYQCSRDEPDAWTNLRLAMRSAGLRLDARWVDGSCRLRAVRVTDWRGRVDSDLVSFDLTSDLLVTNHLKAAGKGELASREVADVYADRYGNVGQNKSLSGVFELEEYYDANNSEGDDLREQATNRLKDAQGEGGVTVTVDEGVEFGLGDTVEARHYAPNVTVSVEISSKVITATGAGASITYGASPSGTRMG